MGAICGADFLKLHTGARHNVGHAERAANLNKFAAGHHGFAALCQAVEHEQDGGGVVVDDRRVLGTGEFANQSTQMIVAIAAFAGLQIKLKRDSGPHRSDAGFDGRFSDDCTAEVRVQHRTGEIEDGLYFGPCIGRKDRQCGVGDGFGLARLSFSGAQGGPLGFEHLTQAAIAAGRPKSATASRAASVLRTVVHGGQNASCERQVRHAGGRLLYSSSTNPPGHVHIAARPISTLGLYINSSGKPRGPAL